MVKIRNQNNNYNDDGFMLCVSAMQSVNLINTVLI